MSPPEEPVFQSPDFLEQHVQDTLAFYEPRVFSPEGGFYSCFLDNGDCFDPHSRQLVGSARYVVNYATAYCRYGSQKYQAWAQWGLDYLTKVHKQDNGHYAWLLERNVVTDSRVMAYGQAFVLLAASACLRAGIASASTTMNDTFDFLEKYFWDDVAIAYADERDASLEHLSPYRGQNANISGIDQLALLPSANTAR